jgi:serine/threonine-protein kinase
VAWTFANRYDCQEQIGFGRFGDVWRAVDTNLEREMALKILALGSRPELAFEEGRRLMALESTHTIRVFNADVHADIPYLAMELAPRGSVEDRLGSRGLAVSAAVNYARDLLRGLQHCHDSGLVHRDVKPSNVLLVRDDKAKLGDFGVAAAVDSNGVVALNGDWQIVAPEGVTSSSLDRRSDIFSAGVTLYRMLCGQWPLDADSPTFQADLVAGRFPKLRDLAPHVPQTLALRLAKATAVDPAARYSSAEEMHSALDDVGTGVDWHEINPHLEHFRCWTGHGNAEVSVCTWPAKSGTWEVEVRSLRGAQQRDRKLSGPVTAKSVPLTALRKVFMSFS